MKILHLLNVCVVAVAMMFSVMAQASSHGGIYASCMTGDMLSQRAVSHGVPVAMPTLAQMCQEWSSAPVTNASYKAVNSVTGLDTLNAAVGEMQMLYQELNATGVASGLPDPAFLLAADSAKHEWVPALKVVAAEIMLMKDEGMFSDNPYLTVWLDSVSRYYADTHAMHMANSNSLSDKTHEGHYALGHNLADSVMGLLAQAGRQAQEGSLSPAVADRLFNVSVAQNAGLSTAFSSYQPQTTSAFWLQSLLLGAVLLVLSAFAYRRRFVN